LRGLRLAFDPLADLAGQRRLLFGKEKRRAEHGPALSSYENRPFLRGRQARPSLSKTSFSERCVHFPLYGGEKRAYPPRRFLRSPARRAARLIRRKKHPFFQEPLLNRFFRHAPPHAMSRGFSVFFEKSKELSCVE